MKDLTLGNLQKTIKCLSDLSMEKILKIDSVRLSWVCGEEGSI